MIKKIFTINRKRFFFVSRQHQYLVRDCLARLVTLLTRNDLRLIHTQSTCWFACVTGAADCARFKTTALDDFQQHVTRL